MQSPLRASVICTVLNEGQAVRRLMDSLAAQTRCPDEVVIVDGGSQDDTVAVMREYASRLPLQIIVSPGANISQGRNRAIAAATGEAIAVTDAGVWLEPEWLVRLIAPLEQGAGQAAAGFFVADPQTPFEVAMGATVLPALEDVDPAGFLPSSRSVAFLKSAWEAAGGYPEWLDYCEDLVFDMRVQDQSGPFAWAPGALAHFRPRGSLRAFFRQYYRYARGDGKADLWRRRHAIRYGTYLVALPALVALAVWRKWPAVFLLAGAWAYCRRPYRRLSARLPGLAPVDRARAVCYVPLIRLVGDLAKMLGYPAGWLWRVRRRRDPEIWWRG